MLEKRLLQAGIMNIYCRRIGAPASKSEYLFEVVDAQAAFPASRLEREIVILLAENS